MFKSKTVFVLGAGASKEAGLPTGAELKHRIAEKLNFWFEFGALEPKTGDLRIANELREYITGKSEYGNTIQPFVEEAWRIRDAMPQAISIDNFIDAHAGNERLELCGKLAIAQCILEAERQSPFCFDQLKSGFPFEVASETWYGKFFQLLTENVRRDASGSLFDNVAFIDFNYDRSISHFLFFALQTYYGMRSEEAAQLLDRLRILHPYGSVGPLSWQCPRGVEFGAKRLPIRLLEVAGRLKTFTEQSGDKEAENQIRDLVQQAETIIFLGFAFHELNMLLLTPPKCEAKAIFATAYGISGADTNLIENQLRPLTTGSAGRVLIVNPRLTCSELFTEYWRSLTAQRTL